MRIANHVPGLALVGGWIAWVILTGLSLTTYPAPKADEAWFSAASYQLLTHGEFGLPLYADLYGSSHQWFFAPRIYVVLQASWLAVSGPGLWASRMFSVFGAVLAAGLTQRLGSRLYNSRVGWLAALLFLFSWRTFHASHWARPDIWVATVGAGGLALLLWALQREYRGRWLVLGLYAGWMPSMYVIGVNFTFTIGCLVLWLRGWHRNRRAILWFGFGVTLSLAVWIAVTLLPDIRLMMDQVRLVWLAGVTTGVPPISARLPYLLNWLKFGFLGLTRFSWIEALYFVGGLTVLGWRRQAGDRLLLLSLVSFLLAYALITTTQSAYHAIIVMPLLCLATAAGTFAVGATLARRLKRLRLSSVNWAFAMISPLITLYLGGDIRLAWANRNVNYENYVRQLQRYIPTESNIFGEAIWWYGFPTSTLTADDIMFSDPAMRPNRMSIWLEELFTERRIEYALVDEQFGSFYLDTFVGDSIRETLLAYLVEHCRRVGTVSGILYGAEQWGPAPKVTEVYRCSVE